MYCCMYCYIYHFKAKIYALNLPKVFPDNTDDNWYSIDPIDMALYISEKLIDIFQTTAVFRNHDVIK